MLKRERISWSCLSVITAFGGGIFYPFTIRLGMEAVIRIGEQFSTIANEIKKDALAIDPNFNTAVRCDASRV